MGTRILAHRVQIERNVRGREYRYRAVCLVDDCSFRSPWLTNRGAWPDSRFRSWLWPRSRAIKAADRHIRGTLPSCQQVIDNTA